MKKKKTSLQLFLLLLFLHTLPIKPDPVQPFIPKPISPPVTTIPAFPEQSSSSSSSGCPLDLPNDLFPNIKSACTGKKHHGSGELNRVKCCPVLAAWLYSAYSATALGKINKYTQQTAMYHDLPLLPNDSETCVENLENGLRKKGIELVRLNESCDVVYCECGIKLHPLSCPEAFSVNSVGDLVGNYRVKKLEKDCFNNGCSKCLKSLHLLHKVDTVNTSKSEERTSKMQNEDCELMGLTWLLAKNRSAYIHTVSAVLRAKMMSTDGNSIPDSCPLNSDGLPLAVDSSEINDSSSSSILYNLPLTLSIFSLLIFHVSICQLSNSM
uniref:uncharacterized GPI-anchored protein At4g28100 n=1 Tax=Erigeron canadensis TaxID=72917 RepID=UPI001CB8E885|nr:uncharacterized GPI-anchored protein At4g28100 [Erigeron canadensis]